MLEHITAKAMHRITKNVTPQDKVLVKRDKDFYALKEEQTSTVKDVPRAHNAPPSNYKKNNFLCRHLDEMDKEWECPPETPRNRHYGRK